ncbi:MAG: exodeoxyribonuclease VII small subunit, partial [Elusimicrobiota bacterium]
QELEEIVRELSSGNLPLDESIKLYEKGMKNKKYLREKLQKAKNTIKLLREKEGEYIEEDFEYEQK